MRLLLGPSCGDQSHRRASGAGRLKCQSCQPCFWFYWVCSGLRDRIYFSAFGHSRSRCRIHAHRGDTSNVWKEEQGTPCDGVQQWGAIVGPVNMQRWHIAFSLPLVWSPVCKTEFLPLKDIRHRSSTRHTPGARPSMCQGGVGYCTGWWWGTHFNPRTRTPLDRLWLEH